MGTGRHKDAIARVPEEPLRVVMLAAPPVQELDVTGPVGVFAVAGRTLGRRGSAYKTELVSADRRRLIAGDAGLALEATAHYSEVRGKIDTLLVAGGSGAQRNRDPALMAWLRRVAPRTRRF